MTSVRYDDKKGSPDRFGYSWEKFSVPTPDQERQFRGWTVHLWAESDWKDKRFLDAGCGAGRSSFWVMSFGARSCVSIDLEERPAVAAVRSQQQIRLLKKRMPRKRKREGHPKIALVRAPTVSTRAADRWTREP